MTFFTVAQRELIAAAHRPGTYRLRWGIAGFAAAFSILLLTFGDTFNGGHRLYVTLGYICLVMSSLAGLFLTSDSISSERREGTLGLLYLTELRPLDVLIGKLLAGGLNAFCVLLAVFPMWALGWTAGGVTGSEVVRSLMVTFNILFVSLCAGLAVSTRTQRVGSSIAGTGILLFGLVAWISLFSSIPSDWRHVAALSPFLGITESHASNYKSGEFWWHLFLGNLTGWLLMAIAAMTLGRRWISRDTEVPLPNAKRRRPRQIPVHEDRHDFLPIVVRSLLIPEKSLTYYIWYIVAILAALTGSLFLFFGSGFADFYLNYRILLNILLRVLYAWEAVAFVALAKQSGELELLLTTPILDSDIRAAQSTHLANSFILPFFALYLVDTILVMLGVQIGLDSGFSARLTVAMGFDFILILFQFFAIGLGGLWWGISEKKVTVAFAKNLIFCALLPIPLVFICCLGFIIPLIQVPIFKARLRKPMKWILNDR